MTDKLPAAFEGFIIGAGLVVNIWVIVCERSKK